MLLLAKTVLIIISLTLVAESWPRFLAGMTELEPITVYRANKQQRSLGGMTYERVLSSVRRSTELDPESSLYYAQAADLHLRNAIRLAEEGELEAARVEFDNTRNEAKKGLLRGPSDPYAWFVLAYAEQAIDGPSETALSALNTSFAVSMTEGSLLVPRISWCFSHWSRLPENLKEKARRQIQLALRNNNIRRSLAQYTASLPPIAQEEFLKVVEDVGSGEPDNLPSFQYWLRVSRSGRALQ